MMTSLASRGLVMRRTRFSHTSLIIHWLTDQYGKLRTIAKGALRPKSGFVGKLDLFFHCELLWAHSQKTDLHALKEVSVVEPFAHIRESYVQILAASYFAELVDEATEPEHRVTELYDLLLRAYRYLDARKPDVRAVMFFERELCKHLGVEAGREEPASHRLLEALGRLPQSRGELLQLV